MTDKLQNIEARYTELTGRISDPKVIADKAVWQKLVKEHNSLEETVEEYQRYKSTAAEIEEYKALLSDSDTEMRALAEAELPLVKTRFNTIETNLKRLLLPKDPHADGNVVVEIRPAAGGDEAALFGARLLRMYTRFAERSRFKFEEVDVNMTDLGGVKEAVFTIAGKGVYAKLKYESGVHRVQRVPATESQGRVHTSTVTVAVLPEAPDVEIEINDKDLKIDTYRSGGAGGQHVNKTESAIRITHLPSGLVVTCQDEKSQIKNRETALKVLRTRLYDHKRQQLEREYSANRKAQVGTGDRSERIRTYNFPQGRVTDHRIGFTLYALEDFLDGNIDEMVKQLAIAEQDALMKD